MRRLLAVTLLVLFASLHAMDGLSCPDGCTHEESASPSDRHAPEPPRGSCALCQGGIDPGVARDLAPPTVVASGVEAAPRPSLLEAPAARIEHPPRS